LNIGFIKKYLSLALPVGLVLAAVLLYIPTKMIGKALSSDIARNSLAGAKKIEGMLRSVPSAKQFEMERRYQDRHAEDAKAISNIATQSSQRQLISYQIFPAPKDTSQQLFDEFALSYCEEIKGLVEWINGREAPDDGDLTRKLGYSRGRNTKSSAKNAHDRKVDAVCEKMAKSISVYACPQLFAWYNFWSDWTQMEFPGRKAAIEYCWNSQIAYLIYQDIVDSISQMNADADSVLTSDIKRLMGVSFNKPVTDDWGKVAAVVTTEDMPVYITEPDQFVIGSTVPWTGRISNKDIDVIHFSVAVIIDSKAVMPFMKSLCSQKEHTYRKDYSENGQEFVYKHNQMTILSSEIEPVDPEDKVHQYYRYGDDAVLRLSLVCEYIFNRSGYDKIKPKSIKELLDPQPEKKAAKPARKSRSKKKK
jgi:hypothetical protein